METKKILKLILLLCVSLHLLASDAAKIVGTAVGVGAVYGLARGASQIKICPDLMEEFIEAAEQERPDLPARVMRPAACLGVLIGNAGNGVKAGLFVGVPIALIGCVGSSQLLGVHDVIKPLSLGFGAVWCASMAVAGMGYSTAYRNYEFANTIIERRGQHTWPRRDEADQDEQLKCKSSRLAALYGSNCAAGVGTYGLAIGLAGWAFYKRYQS